MKPSDWIDGLRAGALDARMAQIYPDSTLLSERRDSVLRLLEAFRDKFGDSREAIVVRSPCRINLMGMHVEHRGGYVNYVTHGREILAAAAPRGDRRVEMTDVRSKSFPARGFDIGEEMSLGNTSTWLEYIDSPGVVERVRGSQGDWSNYVKAGVLRLQHFSLDQEVRGMDMSFLGNIPTSSGLSSSSAMVVVSSLALLHLSELSVTYEHLVELCGEGEWYVGTRGGAGDHAAMLFCKPGKICHLRFFPFNIDSYLRIPSGCDLVIANSMKSAHKAGPVLDAYNQTIAAYGMVLMLIKDAMAKSDLGPDLVDGTEHLRDVNPRRFGLAQIYRLLKMLPQRATRAELYDRFPEREQDLNKIFATHAEPEQGYRVRAVAMFGIAECERGRIFAEILGSGDVEALGKLMYVEHDGDRVLSRDPESGEWSSWDNEVRTEDLDQLIADAESDDPPSVGRSQLHMQPGGYGCSSPELDEMVEICRGVEGVHGAGLTGAGFGGCIRVLVDADSTESLLKVLRTEYYDPRGLPQGAERVATVGKAGVLGEQT